MYVTKSRSSLKLFRSTWGLLAPQGGTYPLEKFGELLDLLKTKGYDGVETPCSIIMKIGKHRFKDALERRKMSFIGMVFSSGGQHIVPRSGGITSEDGVVHPQEGRSAREHSQVFAAQVKELTTPNLKHLCNGITAHSGRDYFSFEESHEFLRTAVRIEKETGVLINHETHRGRLLHSPWEAMRLLERHPDIGICADLSHWQVLAESPTSDMELERAISAVLPRTRHIHARVGYEQGPQVPAITGLRWAPYMAAYTRWWDRAMAHAGREGLPLFTCTPEFGPPPYQWATEGLPDIDRLNDSVAVECQKLWQARYGADTGGRVVLPPLRATP